jgi:small ubiquitin-related modifier
VRERELRAAANKLKIYVQTQEGVEACFIVKRNARLGKVFKAYLEQVSLEMKNVRFCFDGEGISEDDTPEELGIEDENIIDCILFQVGC